MLLDVGTFCSWVEGDLNGLVEELQGQTGRSSDWEAWAWERSLPKLSILLANSQLESFHVSLGQQGSVSLEYRLPSSSSWCDAVLLGRGSASPVALILEMKEWDISLDEPGPTESLIRRQGRLQLHPSDQVRGYAEYCRNFHSTVLSEDAQVAGCTFFTTTGDAAAYSRPPHDQLVADYPVFTAAPADLEEAFPAYVSDLLEVPDATFASAFESGRYMQNRAFVEQIAETIRDPSVTQFVLLDEQRAGFHLAMEAVKEVLGSLDDDEKAVILIEGPPGSGKSVVAAHLWAELIRTQIVTGSVVLVTTSASQKSNWEHLFVKAAQSSGGHGVVMPANRFSPGLSPPWVKAQRADGAVLEIEAWRENLRFAASLNAQQSLAKTLFDVAIVDEAHALIDPTAPNARGVSPSGWHMHAGPQAWHIVNQSRVSIFLLHSEQSYRDNETTTTASIEKWAQEFNAPVTASRRISLAGRQFRCGGSVDYVRWLDDVLGMAPSPDADCEWRRLPSNPKGPFGFDIYDTPQDLENSLRARLVETQTVRLVAAYGRPWVTKNEAHPHDVPPEQMDFNIVQEGRAPWSRIWNYAPKADYSLFVQAPPGSPMHDNPLAEVGCPYVVRGFDYDYLGLLWLSDLVWRDGRWDFVLDNVHESAWRKTKSQAAKEAKQAHGTEAHDHLLERLIRGYRVLLTRAIKGMYLWFEDEETRDHVERCLRPKKPPEQFEARGGLSGTKP